MPKVDHFQSGERTIVMVRLLTLLTVLMALLLGSCDRVVRESSERQGRGGLTEGPESASTSGQEQSRKDRVSERWYRLGAVPVDTDTPLEEYLDSVGGVRDQCVELNSLIQEVCCANYELGCEVRFECDLLSIESEHLMNRAAYHYAQYTGKPHYPMNQGSVLRDVEKFLETLERIGRARETLLVGYTRHPIEIDDEETPRKNKINPNNLVFHWLGFVRPGLSAKGGTVITLDYYASQKGLLLSVAPINKASLAQAVTEYRAGTFSFAGKQLTGTGARDFFELDGGRLVPRLSGCSALTRR